MRHIKARSVVVRHGERRQAQALKTADDELAMFVHGDDIAGHTTPVQLKKPDLRAEVDKAVVCLKSLQVRFLRDKGLNYERLLLERLSISGRLG